MTAVALSMSVSCHHSPVPAEEQPGGQEPSYPEEPAGPEEPEDPTVLKVEEGDDLAAILAAVPEGIKALSLGEGTFTGPFKMVEGIDVRGAGDKTILTVTSGRVLTQETDFETLTTWKNLTLTDGRLNGENGAGAFLRKTVCWKTVTFTITAPREDLPRGVEYGRQKAVSSNSAGSTTISRRMPVAEFIQKGL